MMIDSASAPKRPYSAPKLVAYGDMATLTKSGTGSRQEAMVGGRMDRFI